MPFGERLIMIFPQVFWMVQAENAFSTWLLLYLNRYSISTKTDTQKDWIQGSREKGSPNRDSL